MVKNCQSSANLIKAYGVLFDHVKFDTILSPIQNVVPIDGATFITFNACNFTNVKNPAGLGFVGETKKINFTFCNFINFRINAITINSPYGIGVITNNKFISSQYPSAFPLVTAYFEKNKILKNAVLKNNSSLGNFREQSFLDYFNTK